jgi:hypothetical protein
LKALKVLKVLKKELKKKKAMVDGLGGLLTAIIKKTKTNKDV